MILQTGDPAPGHPGVTLGDLTAAGWNDASEVAFVTALHGPAAGEVRRDSIWVPGKRGVPQLVISRNDPLPEIGPEAYYSGFLPETTINNRGDALFALGHGGSGAPRRSFWTLGSKGLELLLLEGDPVPGLPDRSFGRLYFGDLPDRVNAYGEVAIVLHVVGPGIPEFQEHVLLGPTDDEHLGLIAREGDPVPGVPGASFVELDRGPARPIGIDDLGRVAFVAGYSEPGSFTRSGLFRSRRDGTIEALVLAGDPAPGLGPGTEISGVVPPIHVSPAGVITFRAPLSGAAVSSLNDGAVWVWEAASSEDGDALADAEGMRLLTRERDPAPLLPPGAILSDLFHAPEVNDRGEAAFSVGAGSYKVLYRVGREKARIIAKTGDAIEGLPGWLVDDVFSPRINAHGDVLFHVGSVTGTGEDGPFMRAIAPKEGGFLPIPIFFGDVVEVAPGDEREVSNAGVELNDRRELLVTLEFTDGSAAMLCTDVPRGHPLRYRPGPCGRWRSEPLHRVATPLDDLEY